MVSSDAYLRTVTTSTLGVPITTTDRAWPNHIRLTGPHGLDLPSWAMTEQVRALSRGRLTGSAGKVSPECLAQVRLWIADFIEVPLRWRAAGAATLGVVRLGVQGIGSNTVHLLVANVHPGGRPLGTTSQRTTLRLIRYLDADGSINEDGVNALVLAVTEAQEVAAKENVDALLATATSAVREATNGAEVIALIEAALGQELQVLSGEDEARFTYLAVRRWFGWATGQILLFDIGGGSLELAAGADELPDAAASVPLGAGRSTIQFLPHDPPGEEAVDTLRSHARKVLAPVVTWFGELPRPSHVVGSSKAIRSLAKLAGHPAPGRSRNERMLLPRDALGSWIPRLARIPASARQELPGITADRTVQIVAAAVVLHTAMTMMKVDELEVSPWALREGMLLRYIESLEWAVPEIVQT